MAEPANQGNERGDTGPTWPQDGNTQLSLVTSPSSTSTSNAPPLTTSLASPGPSRGRPSLSQGASNSGNGNTTSSTPSSSDDLPTDVIIDLMRNASRAWDPQADFEIDELAALLNRCSSYKLKKGSPIINRSDVASFIAFVLAGAAKVVVGTEEVATLTTGSVLGAEAYFNRAQTRSADVVAGEGTVLIALQYDTIPTLATENPLLYSKFLKMLCVQAVMGTQRQAMDRHRMSLPLYDSSVLAAHDRLSRIQRFVRDSESQILVGGRVAELPESLKPQITSEYDGEEGGDGDGDTESKGRDGGGSVTTNAGDEGGTSGQRGEGEGGGEGDGDEGDVSRRGKGDGSESGQTSGRTGGALSAKGEKGGDSKGEGGKSAKNAVARNRVEVLLMSQNMKNDKLTKKLMEDAKSMKVNLSHEILRLGSRLANMEHTLAAKNKETNDLKKQLSDASAREKGLLLDLAAAETEKLSALEQLNKMKEENERLVQSLDNAQKEAEKGFMTFWENTVGEAKQSELYMKQVIEQNNRAIQMLRVEKQHQHNHIDALMKKIAALKKDKRDLHGRSVKLESEAKLLREALEDERHARIEDLRRKDEAFQRQYVAKDNEVHRLMREEERLKTALRDMNMSLTMERMRVQDLINSQAKVMEFFTWAVKARTRARTIARFFMRYIVLIYCKNVIARRQLSRVCGTLTMLIKTVTRCASNGPEHEIVHIRSELEDAAMLKDSYFGANARRGTAPLLTVTRDAFDRLSLLSGLLQHVTTLVEQHRKTNNSLFSRALVLRQNQLNFDSDTKKWANADAKAKEQIAALQEQVRSAVNQNAILRQYLSDLMRKQFGRNFVPSASLALAMASHGKPLVDDPSLASAYSQSFPGNTSSSPTNLSSMLGPDGYRLSSHSSYLNFPYNDPHTRSGHTSTHEETDHDIDPNNASPNDLPLPPRMPLGASLPKAPSLPLPPLPGTTAPDASSPSPPPPPSTDTSTTSSLRPNSTSATTGPVTALAGVTFTHPTLLNTRLTQLPNPSSHVQRPKVVPPSSTSRPLAPRPSTAHVPSNHSHLSTSPPSYSNTHNSLNVTFHPSSSQQDSASNSRHPSGATKPTQRVHLSIKEPLTNQSRPSPVTNLISAAPSMAIVPSRTLRNTITISNTGQSNKGTKGVQPASQANSVNGTRQSRPMSAL